MEIARASPRLAAIALAAFDYVMDMGTSRGDGTELFYARCAVLHAARVAGIAAYDVVWSDINNEEGSWRKRIWPKTSVLTANRWLTHDKLNSCIRSMPRRAKRSITRWK
ncbi:Citrate lyase beta chain [Klebsiella pneumoniae IS39]|nr:Citrate lyase beta chain [Klebsiella pneumoniae IS39]